jgi:hypothetical protein
VSRRPCPPWGSPALTLALAAGAYAACFAASLALRAYYRLRHNPPVPSGEVRQGPCVETADAFLAFDPDVYDCPCGHAYGDHEFDLPIERPRRMAGLRCTRCPS